MPPPFLQALDDVVARIHGRNRKRLLLAVAALAGALLAAAAAADAFVQVLGSGGRALALALVLGLPGLAFGAGLLVARKRWSRREVARALEARSAQDQELFVTALAVAEERRPTLAPEVPGAVLEQQALQDEFRRLLCARASRRTGEIDTRALVSRHRLAPGAVAAGSVAAVLLAVAIVSPAFRLGLSRVMLPWAAISYSDGDEASAAAAAPITKDQPPMVELVQPRGPEAAATLIDSLACEIRASDDRGLARMGLEMMVDASKTEQGSIVLGRGEREASRALTLALGRIANLRPDSSVLIWAFAEDVAGQRSVSMPVALDLQQLYRAGSLGPSGGGGGDPNVLDQLIADQRSLATRTVPLTLAPSGRDTTSLADEQQSLLARTRALMEGP
jgi:hypothetical protein